jgi:hypothetical protein
MQERDERKIKHAKRTDSRKAIRNVNAKQNKHYLKLCKKKKRSPPNLSSNENLAQGLFCQSNRISVQCNPNGPLVQCKNATNHAPITDRFAFALLAFPNPAKKREKGGKCCTADLPL